MTIYFYLLFLKALTAGNYYLKFRKKESADLVTFTEEILNGKLHVLCSAAEGFRYVIIND